MEGKFQGDTGPVKFERHYEVFKDVEERLKDHLSDLDHEYFLAGLRVAYDVADSSNEPDVFPYRVEFGYLGPVDAAIECSEPQELSDADLLVGMRKGPISIELLDELFAQAKDTLVKEAGQELKIGVFVVLTGSPTLGYSVTCPCKNKTRKKYCYYDRKTKRTKCYCTTRRC